MPADEKPVPDIDEFADPVQVRQILGDGTFGGAYERPDDEMFQLWAVAVAEVRDLIATWPD
jgi:creatinine amidohydrolase